MKLVSIEFKKNGKQYLFYDNNLELNIGDNVVVETERGLQFGSVAKLEESNNEVDHALVLKVATKQDEKQNERNIKEAEKATQKAQELANDYGLEMKFID